MTSRCRVGGVSAMLQLPKKERGRGRMLVAPRCGGREVAGPGPGALGGQAQELETARRRFPLQKPHVAMPRVWEACEKHDVAYGSGFGRLFWRMRTLVESSALVASGVCTGAHLLPAPWPSLELVRLPPAPAADLPGQSLRRGPR